MLLVCMLSAMSYFIGALSPAYFYGKYFKGVDLRKCGSGNLGTTNAFRVFGKKAGIAVLVCDVLKASVAVFIADQVLVDASYELLVCGFAAVLGHVFPFYLGFRGGKGVACVAGVFLYVSPLELVCSLVLFGLVLWRSRFVSLASLVAAFFFPVFVWCNLSGKPAEYSLWMLWTAGILSVGIFVTHRSNILRLLRGQEPKITRSKVV